MKEAIMTAAGFEIREAAIPEYDRNSVLVKSTSCGICEGDLFKFLTRNEEKREDTTGILLGHEGSGIVAAVGENVTGFKPGDPVTALGGSYAEYFVAEPESLALVPSGLDSSMALGEPIACCIAAARRFGIKFGDKVGIIGAGYMGLNCLQLARMEGAAEIVVFDLLDWRLDTALKLGADRVVNTKGKSPVELREELGLFDVFIEATGIQAALDIGTELLEHHGTFNLVGYHQSNDGYRQIDMKTWNYKALTVVNGHIRNKTLKLEDMKAALKLMARGKLNTDLLVTNYPFADINQAFQDLATRKVGLYKANLIF